MIHDRLDIDHWKSVFSVQRMRETGEKPDAYIISSPYDIAVVEQLRAETFAPDPTLEHIPTDVFVWNRGEPTNRAVTHVGDLPYRAAGKPWPLAPSGEPLTFVAQFCFADSRDIVPAIPGDILLFFAEGKEWRYRDEVSYDFSWGDGDERDSALHFEWVNLDDALPLITREEALQAKWRIDPCYAAIYRTWDYPTADGFAYPGVYEHIPEILDATKIGGVCPWRDEVESSEISGGEFLCALSSIFPVIDRPYPFLNVPGPISYGDSRASNMLKIGDVGLIDVFINSNGDLRWLAFSH
jgi:Domain of unknown function (DUF1963)